MITLSAMEMSLKSFLKCRKCSSNSWHRWMRSLVANLGVKSGWVGEN